MKNAILGGVVAVLLWFLLVPWVLDSPLAMPYYRYAEWVHNLIHTVGWIK